MFSLYFDRLSAILFSRFCISGKENLCPNARFTGFDINGGYAEYVVAPGQFVHKIPSGLSLKKAALCEPLAVVIKGLNRFRQLINVLSKLERPVHDLQNRTNPN